MSRPFLSVVVPTRERAETLGYTIETVLADPLEDLELVVSDNRSTDRTPEVVGAFADRRVKYIRTPRRMSMSDNWDFALSHASGEHLLFIGDDDAVMPGSLTRLREFHRAQPADVVTWPWHIYTWPIDGGAASIAHLAPQGQPAVMDIRRTARTMIKMGGWKHYAIPSLYHSMVARGIPDAVRERTGRVFHSMIPDVFFSAVVPCFAETAVSTGFSVSIHGRSPKSHGGSSVARQGTEVQNLFVREYGDYTLHRTLYPGVAIKANMIPDAVLVAMDLFPDFYGPMKFDYDAMWAYVCRLQSFFHWDLSVREIIAKRSEIRRAHPFSVVRFLAYLSLHRAFDVRRALIERTATLPVLEGGVPPNIRDFVRALSPQPAGSAAPAGRDPRLSET